MRLSLRAAIMLLFVCFGLSHALAEVHYDQLKNNCVSDCSSKKGVDKDYCASYCECKLDSLKASGDEAKQNTIMSSPTEIDNIAMACTGKISLTFFVKDCKANCQGAACSRCECLLNEMKALGSDQKIGEFLRSLAYIGSAADAQNTAMEAKCSK
jgi:hypothetical protein